MSENQATESRLALVTGATGFVGGEVAQELLRRGWRVRLLCRSADKVRDLPWGDAVVSAGESADAGQAEVVEGDANDADDLATAMKDVDAAWYLLHSMGNEDDFAQPERDMATAFADAAREAKVGRIVYLGGLHPDDEELSEHLASRIEVGEILMNSGVPTAALQAGVVLGDGSASFEMLRHLAERLPVAVAPKWIRNQIQPIAVADAVHYLVGAADLPADVNRTFDIGGPEPMQYVEMMEQYAVVTGRMKPFTATAPVTTPGWAGHWIGLVTPVSAELAAPLVASLLNTTVVCERDLDDYIGAPPGGHTSFADAVRAATKTTDQKRWFRTVGQVGAATALTALAGSVLTRPNSLWYRTLKKPSWQPPATVFPIVWSALYADIAAVGALSIADFAETDRPDESRAYAVALGANLALNAAWSGVFFRLKNPALATLTAAALTVSSVDLCRRSASITPEKGLALTPYAAWCGFATVLSGTVARLNR